MRALYKFSAFLLAVLMAFSLVTMGFAAGENETEALPIGGFSSSSTTTTQDANETEAIPISVGLTEETVEVVEEVAEVEEVTLTAETESATEAESATETESIAPTESAAEAESVSLTESAAESAAPAEIAGAATTTDAETGTNAVTEETIEEIVVTEDDFVEFAGTICWDDDSDFEELRPDEVLVSVYYYDANGDLKVVNEDYSVPGEDDDPETEDAWEFTIMMPTLTYDELAENGGYFEAFVNPNSEDYYCSDDSAEEAESGYEIEVDTENFTLEATLALVEPEPELDILSMPLLTMSAMPMTLLGAEAIPTLGIDYDACTITAHVAFDDADAPAIATRPSEVTLTLQYLHTDGKWYNAPTSKVTARSITTSEDDNWYAVFEVEGNWLSGHTWRVVASGTLGNYTAAPGDVDNDFTATLTYTPINDNEDDESIIVHVAWNDGGAEESRPDSVKLVLTYQIGGNDENPVNNYIEFWHLETTVGADYYTVTADNDWYLDIDVSKITPSKCNFWVTVYADDEVWDNYTVTPGDASNSYTVILGPGPGKIKASVEWDDGNYASLRPESVELELQYYDDAWTTYDTATTTADDEWKVSFSVDAESLDNYDEWQVIASGSYDNYMITTGDGGNDYTVTFTYAPGVNTDDGTITVHVVWDDDGAVDSRPASVTLSLYYWLPGYEDDIGSLEKKVKASDDWFLTTDIKKAGSAYAHYAWSVTVKSTDKVWNNYTVTPGDESNGYTITLTPASGTITVNTNWLDGNGADRPEAKVCLYKITGETVEYVDDAMLCADTGWTECTFSGLALTDGGVSISYGIALKTYTSG